jgi:AraC family transcriptional regulator
MDRFLLIGASVETCHIRAGATRMPALPHHRLGIHVGPAVNAFCQCDGLSHRRVQSDGDMDIVPAGLDGVWEDDGDCTILRVCLTPALVARAALNIHGNDRQITPQFQLRDDGIRHIAFALRAELDLRDASDRLYAESLATALAVRLVRKAATPPADRMPQMLSPIQKRRLADFIEANLDGDLSLAALADALSISVSHLKVLFRRTFGMPLHQHVIRSRVERAQRLLLSGDMPLSQVALAAGFSHQSHMARCMKRVLGLTPGSISRLRQ